MYRNKQEGTVLFIGLILLVVLTMLALVGMRSSNTQLRIVGNVQSAKQVEAAAQLAIDQALNSVDAFNAPTAPVTVPNLPSGVKVTVSDRQCLRATRAVGYSAAAKILPEDTVWNVQATATDDLTGANVTVTQGVRIRMLAGSCV
jgi:Tfp pilus assembly protein PilX